MAHQFSMQHEDWLPAFSVNCNCEVLDAGLSPTEIIRTDNKWAVRFDWETIGPLNYVMGGTWQLKIFLEKMGAGEVPSNLPDTIVNFKVHPHNYGETIIIDPGKVKAGLYKLTTAITFKGLSGVAGPIALFGEGPLLQFYDGGPIGSP